MSLPSTFVHDMKNYLGIVIGYSNLMLEDLTLGDQRSADLEEIRKAGEAALALMDRWNSPPPAEDVK